MSGQGGPSLPLCPPVVCFLGFTSQPESLGHCPRRISPHPSSPPHQDFTPHLLQAEAGDLRGPPRSGKRLLLEQRRSGCGGGGTLQTGSQAKGAVTPTVTMSHW